MADVEDFIIASALMFPKKSGAPSTETFATKRDDVTGHHSVKTRAMVDNTDPIPTNITNTSPIPVVGSLGDPGIPGTLQSDPAYVTSQLGLEETLISETVPGGKIWALRISKMVCRAYGKYRILVDGVRVDSGVTSPVESNRSYSISPSEAASGGSVIEFMFTQSYGPTGIDAASFIRYTET